MEKELLLNKNVTEMQEFARACSQPVYRAQQLLEWIYQKQAVSFDEMSNLPKAWRAALQETTHLTPFRSFTAQISTDHTRKYVFELFDGLYIESVCIPMKENLTLCISTQVGCALQCAFCVTGQQGFSRNLSTGEILGQILAVQRDTTPGSRISNIVFMGMGEPLLNYEETVKAIRIMLDENGLNFSNRKITLSTAGIVPGIIKLGQENFTINLAVSLNAARDTLRSQLMPINRSYPVKELLQACRDYPLPERRRITFEYIMFDQLNDTAEHARELAALLRGIRCKINLIPLNVAPDIPFIPSSEEKILAFQKILLKQDYSTFIRASKGADILAACGQLSARFQSPTSLKHVYCSE